jgi:hypothetical protein
MQPATVLFPLIVTVLEVSGIENTSLREFPDVSSACRVLNRYDKLSFQSLLFKINEFHFIPNLGPFSRLLVSLSG